MTKQEKIARKTIGNMKTEKILEVFEATTEKPLTVELAMTRGWLMEEIEKRYPKAFEAWLDSETCEDSELKNYIYA